MYYKDEMLSFICYAWQKAEANDKGMSWPLVMLRHIIFTVFW